ncbi:uncharacterized protein CTRU02_215738 [Colletotrichum truncatum]|uniref:Uncharacterized protein n=1 Tax=Colletotrichum truncatum TaxID=5467 RepID=A0ACC3YBS1_COLTU|nr:uncharacterized protein CTRU02_15202 [Colletotrichum truncatum]KAF6781312.1 hypothetical protein CTRU02_15202 [Colletotrichum truncatum]
MQASLLAVGTDDREAPDNKRDHVQAYDRAYETSDFPHNSTNRTEMPSSLKEILETIYTLTPSTFSNNFTSPSQIANAHSRVISLHYPEALELIHGTLRSNSVESSRLKVEYYPDEGYVRFKMPESVVHTTLHRKFN